MTDAEKLESNIRQMVAALKLIKAEAGKRDCGGDWAAGIAAICLASLRP